MNSLEESYTPSEPQPGDTLTLRLRQSFRALTVSRRDLEQLSAAALRANLPEGYTAMEATLTIHDVTEPVWNAEEQRATWRIQAVWQALARLDPSRAIHLALGRSPQEARTLLEAQFPLSQPAEVHAVPSWWPRLPFLPFRISVTIGPQP